MEVESLIDVLLADPKLNGQNLKHLRDWTADGIAKAITHFAFRNGPVEDMHASPNSQLSDSDMKVLNKFIHNRLTYVVELVMNQRWTELALLLDTYKYYGTGWDPAEPDDGDLRTIISMQYENYLASNKRASRVEHKPTQRKAADVAASKMDIDKGGDSSD